MFRENVQCARLLGLFMSNVLVLEIVAKCQILSQILVFTKLQNVDQSAYTFTCEIDSLRFPLAYKTPWWSGVCGWLSLWWSQVLSPTPNDLTVFSWFPSGDKANVGMVPEPCAVSLPSFFHLLKYETAIINTKYGFLEYFFDWKIYENSVIELQLYDFKWRPVKNRTAKIFKIPKYHPT